MLLLIVAAFACPETPTVVHDDAEVTALSQNLKFIATGLQRERRARVLAGWLDGPGEAVDLLMLSEARILGELVAALPGFCFYTQAGDGVEAPYTWEPLSGGEPPAGLALAVRQRSEGVAVPVGVTAGRRFRARPTSAAEGFLGKVFGYHKGWAELSVGDTRLVWSHLQASYTRRPEVGAGGPDRGRAGQVRELAETIGPTSRPTLLTGDLNLLDSFFPDGDHSHFERAREVDGESVALFESLTGLRFRAPWQDAEGGTFLGSLVRGRGEGDWDVGASYDRVALNDAFLAQHPGTRVRKVAIADGDLRVSDHLGLEIVIPFLGP